MPLRYIKRPKLRSQDVVQTAISVASLTKELTSVASFPPATAAVSVVLLILETIQSVQSNKEACYRLARRCARMLLDINDRMDGRWDTAPPSLIKNLEKFQGTLRMIHEFMKLQVDAKWSHRLLKKPSIEDALTDLNAELDDAAQAFQIATLIDIHYAVTNRPKQIQSIDSLPPYNLDSNSVTGFRTKSWTVESPVDLEDKKNVVTNGAFSNDDASSRRPLQDEEVDDIIITDGILEDRGFRRYHQSEVRLKGLARVNAGWWAGTSLAEVNGQPSLIKRYEGPHQRSIKSWIRDVKILQNLYHPNLPQMIGYSAEGAPTPFILLSNVQTRSPQALLLNILRGHGLAATIQLFLRFYQDITEATLYAQKQLNLDDGSAQDFVEQASFRVDGSSTMITGLPPPKDGWITARSYGLTESLQMVVMKMLPKQGTSQNHVADLSDNEEDEIARRIAHLTSLCKGLLPRKHEVPTLSSRVRGLLGLTDIEGESMPPPKLSLKQLRLSNLEAQAHDFTWYENGGIPSHKFAVGDIGYIPKGQGLNAFVTLANVLNKELASFPLVENVSGRQWSWQDIPTRDVSMEPYTLPDNVKCWPIAVPPGAQIDCQIAQSKAIEKTADAWRFLLMHGRTLADEFGVEPEDLIFITRAGTNQDFYIRDFSRPAHVAVYPLSHNQSFGRPQPFGGLATFGQQRPAFGVLPPMLPTQRTLPTIMYLFTSPDPTFSPYWSHELVNPPKGMAPRPLQHGWTYKIGWSTGYINWAQLHADDFIMDD